MSGKLIMKRKLHKEQSQLQPFVDTTDTAAIDDAELTTTQNLRSMRNSVDESSNDSSVPIGSASQSKRMRCDTPPPEHAANRVDCLTPPLLDDQDNFLNQEHNRHLLEAIQAKMLELQQELDEFEHDLEANEEDYYNGTAAHPYGQPPQMSEQEAEALGYAMCAQETMLFLQREGVPADSLLYTRLRDALVGQAADTDRVFHVGAQN